MYRHHLLLRAAFATLALLGGEERAAAEAPAFGGAGFHLDLHTQYEGVLFATLPFDDAGFGGVEGRFDASIMGFGAADSPAHILLIGIGLRAVDW